MSAALYLAGCLLMWGLATFAMKWTGSRLDPFTMVVCNTIGYVVMGLILLPRSQLATTSAHALGVGIAVLFVFGNLAFYKLSQTEQVSVLAPLTGLYTTIPVTLGFVLLREPVTLRKCAGIGLALMAIYLLSTGERDTPAAADTPATPHTPKGARP